MLWHRADQYCCVNTTVRRACRVAWFLTLALGRQLAWLYFDRISRPVIGPQPEGGFSVLYLGPDTVMPLASAVAVLAFGFVVLAGR